jgi:hypothetical protein
MLARTRVDPKTLHRKCTEAHLDAMLDLARMFRDGEVKHRARQHWDRTPRKPQMFFNMIAWNDHHECGTVRCIGGWLCALHPELKFNYMADTGSVLCSLFHPDTGVNWDRITTADAADALEATVRGEKPWG